MADEQLKINVNTADAETLTQLNGIGTSIAERIIEYRETVHPFEEVIELTAVPGISERMVRTFEDRVVLEEDDVITQMAAKAPTPLTDETAVALAATATALPDDIPEEIQDDSEVPPGATEAHTAVDSGESDDSDDSDAEAAAEEEVEAETAADEADKTDETDDTPTGVIVPPTAPADSMLPAAAVPAGVGSALEPESDADAEDAETETAVAPTPTPIPEPEPTPATARSTSETTSPPPPPAASPTPDDDGSTRRGCMATALGAVLGAVLGAIITLAVMAAINGGSLSYAQQNAQTQQELIRAQSQQATLEAAVNGLNAQLTTQNETTNENFSALATLQANTDAAVIGLEDDLDSTGNNLSAVATAVGAQALRIDTVAESAETFDTFLNGLRDMLIEIQGPPTITATTTPTATLTITPTPTAADTTATPADETESEAEEEEVEPTATFAPIDDEDEAEPTATVRPTRTPRPTATPIMTATPTAEPQP